MTQATENHVTETLRAGSEAQQTASERAATAARAVAERAAAEGLVDISYASLDSPFGTLLIAGTRKGLVRVAFPEEPAEGVLEALARQLSPRILEAPAALDRHRRELDEYFAGRRHDFEEPLDWALIEGFGQRVLRVTAAIPYGASLSYGEVAAKAGNPRASRAAGNALGANPIPIVIPCHRVLKVGGTVGNYAGGPERKRWLLELEGAIQPSLIG